MSDLSGSIADMPTDHVPVALARRQRVWSRLLTEHHEGLHHPLLCASPRACEAYERVLTAQNELVASALKLPPDDRDFIAQQLETPGITDFSSLVNGVALQRLAALRSGAES